jgi:hypothetical protein
MHKKSKYILIINFAAINGLTESKIKQKSTYQFNVGMPYQATRQIVNKRTNHHTGRKVI